jgi:hypothetical protein
MTECKAKILLLVSTWRRVKPGLKRLEVTECDLSSPCKVVGELTGADEENEITENIVFGPGGQNLVKLVS